MVLRKNELDEVIEFYMDLFHNPNKKDNPENRVKPFIEKENPYGHITYHQES